MKSLILVIPCYNEEKVLPIFYDAVIGTLRTIQGYHFHFLFIDDGSSDRTLEVMRALREKDRRVQYVSLARNFGKEAAMLAGFDYAEGDAVIVMDADLQDPPELIPRMIEAWEQGYDDVYAKRRIREGESWFKKFSSKVYYRLLSRLSDVPVLVDVGDFRLLDRRCVLALRELRESQRYTKGLFSWIGYRKKAILYDREARQAGETHWGWWQLFALALDGITSFSTMPLHIASWIGIFVSMGALFYMLWVVVRTVLYGDPVAGYPSLIAIVLFLSGIQLIALGVIGLYLGKNYNESKRRPAYLVGEKMVDSLSPCGDPVG